MGKVVTLEKTYFGLGNILWLLWGTLGIMILSKAILHHSILPANIPELSLFLIVLHAMVATILFLGSLPLKITIILIGGYFFRLFFLITDRFFNVTIPFFEGRDSDGFFSAAFIIAGDLTLAGDTYGGVYTGFLGYLFYLIGPDRLLAQYLNVILGITTLLLITEILQKLQISSRITLLILSIAAFMPLVAIHSSLLLRESIIQTLVTVALFFFLRGMFESNFLWTAISLFLVLIASTFHAGVVGILLGFALSSTFTYVEGGKFKFGLRRIAPACLLGFTTLIVLTRYPALFLGKFQSLESPEDLIEHGLTGRGGAAYLTSIEVTDWFSFIIYAPLRAFYFILSPMPWDWRGVGDALSFITDSSVYLLVVFLFLVKKINNPNRRYLILTLVFVLIITCLIFGIGVSNSGTAIRHRTKIIAFFLVLCAIIFDSSQRRVSKFISKSPSNLRVGDRADGAKVFQSSGTKVS